MSDLIICRLDESRTTRDGGLRLTLRVSAIDAPDAHMLCGQKGSMLVLARLAQPAAEQYQDLEAEKARRGQLYSSLYRFGWWHNPQVAPAIARDADFLVWLRSQPCAKCGALPPSDPAHVRRVAAGAGVGIKPPFSAMPLCHPHHLAQHQHGESVLGDRTWYDGMAAKYRVEFLRMSICTFFEVASLTDIDPADFTEWIADLGVLETLPPVLRAAHKEIR